ncbi:MAG TPA: tetratricopeptide repeat protein, partial [Oxalicibacterium sp.]|nr:tetratricopeptide repeat protein [Oxalicibacterium sp.]
LISAMQQSIPVLNHWWGKWLVSIFMQTNFFFDYLWHWLVPDVHTLSIDMRVDFVQIWFSGWSWGKAILFCVFPLTAIYGLRRAHHLALFCCGALYVWILFLTEFASVRFQEPFVLYRSYLWAPGYAMILISVFVYFPKRWIAWFSIPLLCIFFLLARERLSTFENDATLWKDAAQKLGSASWIGSERIFYNRGNALFAEKMYSDAIEDYSRAIKQNPNFAEAYYNRALAYYASGKRSAAEDDINRVLKLDDRSGAAYYTKGFLLQQRGCVDDARKVFEKSAEIGNLAAKMKLKELNTKRVGSTCRITAVAGLNGSP